MKGSKTQTRRLPRLLGVGVLPLMLAGCLTGGETTDDPTAVVQEDLDIQVSGSVGDGPIVGAAMRVLANDGSLLAEFSSSSTADYDVTIKTKGKNYPLSIDARDGTDLVTNLPPDFDLRGAVLDPSKQAVANINPYSTIAAEMVTDMSGGVTKSNFTLAESIVVEQLNFGLDSLAESGPMTTEITAGNIAEIVRASEALGELIRRTRDWLRTAGANRTGDQVLAAIASDLVDGVIDGRGGARSDARTAAIASVVAAQIALETISNELHVNGVDGTGAMASAIRTVSGSSSTQTLSDLTATAQILYQARIGLRAAMLATGDARLAALLDVVTELQAGLDAMLVRNLLPADYRQQLDSAISLVATGDSTIVEDVNSTVRTGEATLVANRAPTISGTPARVVLVGNAYSFTPSAADADGDSLTFSVSNLPSWASFNAANGTISGTPEAADVNTYSNITIAVSDGTESTSLAPFSITVEAISTGSTTLSWTAPTENTDGTALTNLAGYKIYWGQNGSYPNSVTIDNPGITTYVVENLASGSWDFVSTAFNTDGVESEFSNVTTKVIP